MNHLGDQIVLNIRRLRCVFCRRIHHELPDFLVPYKRYDAESIERVVSSHANADIPADESTLYRWRDWFRTSSPYWLGCLSSIAIRFSQDPVNTSSVASQSALHRIGRYVGDAVGWLARVVRPITNLNLWVHTRSAYVSETF